MEEIWKAVPGYPTYEVSNLGRIRSYRLAGRRKELQEIRKQENPTILHPILTPYGYQVITLRGKVDRRYMVHRLVLLAFVGPPPKGQPATRHLNSIRNDNRLANLCWGSMKENMQDCKDIGHYRIGSERYGSKLNDEKVTEIRRKHQTGASYRSLGRKYGICDTTVKSICAGKTWKHLLKESM